MRAIRGPNTVGRWYWRAERYQDGAKATCWVGWLLPEEVDDRLEALATAADVLHDREWPVRTPRGRGWVYFVHPAGGGPIKIGWSRTSPVDRLAELQIGSPVIIELIGAFRAEKHDESDLHEEFAALRMHGEWFRPSAELWARIDDLTRSGASNRGTASDDTD